MITTTKTRVRFVAVAVCFVVLLSFALLVGAQPVAAAGDTCTVTYRYRTDAGNPDSCVSAVFTYDAGEYAALRSYATGANGWEYDGALFINWNGNVKFQVNNDMVLEAYYAADTIYMSLWLQASFGQDGYWHNFDYKSIQVQVPQRMWVYLPEADIFSPMSGSVIDIGGGGGNRTMQPGEYEVLGWYNQNVNYSPEMNLDSNLLYATGGKYYTGDYSSPTQPNFTAIVGEPQITYTVAFKLAGEDAAWNDDITAIKSCVVNDQQEWQNAVTVPAPKEIDGKYYVWTCETASLPQNPNDVADDYSIGSDITYVLTYYNKTDITLTAASKNHVYDDVLQTVAGYSITGGQLKNGHVLYYDGVAYVEGQTPTAPALVVEQKYVGNPTDNAAGYALVLDLAKIDIREGDKSVKDQYGITTVDGGLTITARPITLQVGSDWAWHTGGEITRNLNVTDVNGSLVSGHSVGPDSVSISGTDARVYTTAALFSILDCEVPVTDQYSIVVVQGEFEIKALQQGLNGSMADVLGTYDGMAHAVEAVEPEIVEESSAARMRAPEVLTDEEEKMEEEQTDDPDNLEIDEESETDSENFDDQDTLMEMSGTVGAGQSVQPVVEYRTKDENDADWCDWYVGAAPSRTNAGVTLVEWRITCEGYVPVQGSASITIAVAPLVVTAGSYTVVLGAAVPTLGVVFSGFVNGETSAVLRTWPVLTTTYTQGAAAGSYLVLASGAVSDNYAISYVDGIIVVLTPPRQVAPAAGGIVPSSSMPVSSEASPASTSSAAEAVSSQPASLQGGEEAPSAGSALTETVEEDGMDIRMQGLQEHEDAGVPIVNIGNVSIPLLGLRNSRHWSLVNLLLALFGVFAAIWMFMKSKRQDEEELKAEGEAKTEATKRQRHRLFGRIATIAAGVLGVFVFVFVEDMRQIMVLVNWWTILMAGLFAVELVCLFLYKGKQDSQEEAMAKLEETDL